MPTARIRLKASGLVSNKSEANHNLPKASGYRLQIIARTATATNSSPTKRSMIVPILGGGVRNGIGSLLSGRTVFMQEFPGLSCTWSRMTHGRFKAHHDIMASSPNDSIARRLEASSHG